MHSTLNPKQNDDPHDVLVVAPDVVPVAPTDEELSKLAHTLRHPSNPQTRTGSDLPAGPMVPPVDTTFRPAVEAATANAAPPQPAPVAQTAPEGVAPTAAAPSVESAQSLRPMAHDIASVGQEIEQLKASIEQLKASQQQMSRDIAKASEQNLRLKISSPPPRSAAARARRPMPPLPPPQAAAPYVPRQPEPQPQATAQPQADPE